MKWIDDRSLHDLTMRYAADRICLWRLCGNRVCLRVRACRGDVRRGTSLMAGWIDAIEEEKKRVRGNFAGLESEIKTFEQLRVYLAWREALDRAVAGEKADPRETERDRREVARLIENTCKTMAWEREEAARKEREERLSVGEGRGRGEKLLRGGGLGDAAGYRVHLHQRLDALALFLEGGKLAAREL
ncbi:MAG: hypothetical protein ACR2GC_08415 [Methyloceanibacter sp.]|uniref:hypothetical protein n=1 Tax=Methyloceanibacter sp. TaxID=1965321 RepID=UPI003D9B2799